MAKKLVFISYKRTDAAFARLVYEKLVSMQRGVEFFFDVESLGSGTFSPKLTQAIVRCSHFVLILGKETLHSEWVRREVALALQNGKQISVIAAEGVTYENTTIPTEIKALGEHNWIFYSHQYAEAAFEKLCRDLGLRVSNERRYSLLVGFMTLAVLIGMIWVSRESGTLTAADGTSTMTAMMTSSLPTLVPSETAQPATTDTPLATTVSLSATPSIVLPVGGRCPGFLPSRLIVGQQGRVTPGGNSNVLRASPTGERVGTIPPGGVFSVLEGPVCTSNGIAWWRVNYNGSIGYMGEGQFSTYWAEPFTEVITRTVPRPLSIGITGVTASVSNVAGAACPKTINFRGQIVVNGPGTVTYRWERSDGATAPVETWTATAGALTRDATLAWTVGATNSYGARIQVLTPNVIASNQAVANVNCEIAPPSPQVSSVVVGVSPASSSTCPSAVFTFSAAISTNGPVTVSYVWERSDGAGATPQTLVFAAAGSRTVTQTWTIGAGGTFWKRVKILSPNTLTSNQATFTRTACS